MKKQGERRVVVHVHDGKRIVCGRDFMHVTSTAVSEDATCRKCRTLSGEAPVRSEEPVGKDEEE